MRGLSRPRSRGGRIAQTYLDRHYVQGGDVLASLIVLDEVVMADGRQVQVAGGLDIFGWGECGHGHGGIS